MDETAGAQQGPPPIPPMPPAPPEKLRGNRRSFLTGAAVGAVVAAALTAGGFLLAGEPDSSSTAAKEDSKPATTASASPVESEEVAESEDPDIYNRTPDASDFKLDLKTTSKHCFGSAGCNVTVEPDLTYTDAFPLDPSATISITYEVHGDEGGPVIETMELTSQDQLSFTPVSISIPGSGTKVTAKVTDVQVSH